MCSEHMHGGPEESLDHLSQVEGLIGLKGKQPAVGRRACRWNSHRFRELGPMVRRTEFSTATLRWLSCFELPPIPPLGEPDSLCALSQLRFGADLP